MTAGQRRGGTVYYGWVVVAVTVAALLLAAGGRSAPGVFLLPMEADLSLSRGVLSLAGSLGMLTFGLAAPFTGGLIDRHGPRRVATVGLLAVAVAFAVSTLARSPLALHLTWGVFSGVATGLVGSVLGATVATRWFRRRRGLVVGLFGAATSAGQLMFIPLLTVLASSAGWKGGSLVLAGLAVALAPVVWWLMRDSPADLNLAPDGDPVDAGPAGAGQGTLRADPQVMRRAVRRPEFWLLAVTFFVCGATSTGIVGMHFMAFCGDLGLTAGFAAGMLALMGTFNFVGTLGSGYLTDRVDPRLLLGAYYAFRGLSLVLLPLVPPGAAFLAFAVLFGLDYIATVPPTTALTADVFGRENVGVVYGWVFFAHQLGAALAAWLGGVARDALGSYTPAFIAAAVLAGAAALLALRIQPARSRLAAA